MINKWERDANVSSIMKGEQYKARLKYEYRNITEDKEKKNHNKKER